MGEHTGFHNEKHYSLDCPKCNQWASLTPPWVIEQEKEQNDKLVALKRQINIKREYAFGESNCGNETHRLKFLAMVNAYNTVLRLIKEMI